MQCEVILLLEGTTVTVMMDLCCRVKYQTQWLIWDTRRAKARYFNFFSFPEREIIILTKHSLFWTEFRSLQSSAGDKPALRKVLALLGACAGLELIRCLGECPDRATLVLQGWVFFSCSFPSYSDSSHKHQYTAEGQDSTVGGNCSARCFLPQMSQQPTNSCIGVK